MCLSILIWFYTRRVKCSFLVSESLMRFLITTPSPSMRTLVPVVVSSARISKYIPQWTPGCNYLSLFKIHAIGTKIFIYLANTWRVISRDAVRYIFTMLAQCCNACRNCSFTGTRIKQHLLKLCLVSLHVVRYIFHMSDTRFELSFLVK